MSCHQPYSEEDEKRRKETFNRMFPFVPFPQVFEKFGPQFDMRVDKIGEGDATQEFLYRREAD